MYADVGLSCVKAAGTWNCLQTTISWQCSE